MLYFIVVSYISYGMKSELLNMLLFYHHVLISVQFGASSVVQTCGCIYTALRTLYLLVLLFIIYYLICYLLVCCLCIFIYLYCYSCITL